MSLFIFHCLFISRPFCLLFGFCLPENRELVCLLYLFVVSCLLFPTVASVVSVLFVRLACFILYFMPIYILICLPLLLISYMGLLTHLLIFSVCCLASRLFPMFMLSFCLPVCLLGLSVRSSVLLFGYSVLLLPVWFVCCCSVCSALLFCSVVCLFAVVCCCSRLGCLLPVHSTCSSVVRQGLLFNQSKVTTIPSVCLAGSAPLGSMLGLPGSVWVVSWVVCLLGLGCLHCHLLSTSVSSSACCLLGWVARCPLSGLSGCLCCSGQFALLLFVYLSWSVWLSTTPVFTTCLFACLC